MKKKYITLIPKLVSLLVTLAIFSSFTVTAQCSLLNETFSVDPVLSATNVDGAWYPDRFPPAAFVSDNLGVNKVLKISIDGINDGAANRPPAFVSTFYNTQGRKFNQCGRCVTVAKADLWIPADWETKHRRSDMWATAYDATNTISAYPIIGFRNVDGNSPGIYYYDIVTDNWVNSGVTIVYDSWYKLQFRLVGANLEYLVNNVVVGAISANSSTYFSNIIMQAYNFNDPALAATYQSSDSYNAFWDNLQTTGTGGNVVINTSTGETFCSIQAAIDATNTVAGNTIIAGPGTYNEDVNLHKAVTLKGTSPAQSIISGPIGGQGSTVAITVSNAVIEGFTITRDGNNTTDWTNPGLNSAGVSIQGLAISGVSIKSNIITGMRTAIDINNSNGHSILNNIIDFNRTGLIFRNQTDNMTVTENQITNNWTVGILFLDASGGSNSPVQTAANGAFNSNNISGNWYGQIVDRQSGGSLPAPGTNLKNFTCNWYGSTSPVVTTANSTEPGYAAQIPVAYGGTAVPPGGQPDIAGPASANFVYIPYLVNGADNDGATMGFQPVPGSCNGPAPKLTATINSVTVTSNANGIMDDNGTVNVCNTPNNLTFNLFSDVNNVAPASKVKAFQELVTLDNVTVPFCNNCAALLTTFPGVSGSVALVNPAISGQLVIRFRAFFDLNNNNSIDPGEPVDDWVVYTVNVNATAPSFTRPADKTIPFTSTCGYNATVANTGDVTDESGGLNATFSDQISQCGYNTVIRRTWSLVDNCGNAAADQVQTITVTDNNTSYIIYAIKEVKFGENNYIKGDVGVTDSKGKASFGKNDVLNPFYVRAKNISVSTPSSVTNKVNSAATGGPNPAFYSHVAASLSGTRDQTTNGTVPAGNFKKLTIKKGVTATVNGSNYGKLEVEEGASVTFTNSNINLEEFEVEPGKSTAITNVYFSGCTSVKIRDKVTISEHARVNVDGPKVNFYVGNKLKLSKNFIIDGNDTYVTLNIMIPKGKLLVSGGSVNCIMTGWFIIEYLETQGKNITWNKYGCLAPLVTQAMRPAILKPISIEPSVVPMEIKVYPNPSNGIFTLQLNNKSKTEIVVLNGSGSIIERRIISAGSMKQSFHFDLSKQASGMYIIKLVSEEGIQTNKIIIQR